MHLLLFILLLYSLSYYTKIYLRFTMDILEYCKLAQIAATCKNAKKMYQIFKKADCKTNLAFYSQFCKMLWVGRKTRPIATIWVAWDPVLVSSFLKSIKMPLSRFHVLGEKEAWHKAKKLTCKNAERMHQIFKICIYYYLFYYYIRYLIIQKFI